MAPTPPPKELTVLFLPIAAFFSCGLIATVIVRSYQIDVGISEGDLRYMTPPLAMGAVTFIGFCLMDYNVRREISAKEKENQQRRIKEEQRRIREEQQECIRKEKAARVMAHRSLIRNRVSENCIENLKDRMEGTHAMVPLKTLDGKRKYIAGKGHVVVYTAKLSFELRVPQMNFRALELVQINPEGEFKVHGLEHIPQEVTERAINFIEEDYIFGGTWKSELAPDFAEDVCEHLNCPQDEDLNFSWRKEGAAHMFLLIHRDEVPPFCDGPISLIKRHPKSFVETR